MQNIIYKDAIALGKNTGDDRKFSAFPRPRQYGAINTADSWDISVDLTNDFDGSPFDLTGVLSAELGVALVDDPDTTALILETTFVVVASEITMTCPAGAIPGDYVKAPLRGGSAILFMRLIDADSEMTIQQNVNLVDGDFKAGGNAINPASASNIIYTPATPTDWVDPDPTRMDGAMDALATRVTTFETAQELEFARWDGSSTGLYHADPITINADPTKYDVGVVKGWIMTQGAVPTRVLKEFPATTGHVPSFLATQAVTRVAKDASGAIVEIGGNSSWTELQRRTLLIIGQVTHVDFATITKTGLRPNLAVGTATRLETLAEVIGRKNLTGNVFSSVSATLSMQKTPGTTYDPGANYGTDVNTPDISTAGALNPVVIQHTDSSTVTSITNFIDPSTYELNGSGGLIAVNSNKWTVKRVYLFADNNVAISTGNVEYSTSASALEGRLTEVPILLGSLEQFGTLRAFVIVQEGEIDSDNFIFLEVTDATGGTGSATNTNLLYTASPIDGIVESDTGNDAVITLADDTNAGLQSPGDFTRLKDQSIAAGTDNDQTGTAYTLVLTDADNKTVTMTNAFASTATIPLDSSVAFPIGTKIPITQYGVGILTIDCVGAGVTLNGVANGTKVFSGGQFSAALLHKIGTDTWVAL